MNVIIHVFHQYAATFFIHNGIQNIVKPPKSEKGAH